MSAEAKSTKSNVDGSVSTRRVEVGETVIAVLSGTS